MARFNDNNSQQCQRTWVSCVALAFLLCLLFNHNPIQAAEPKSAEVTTDLRILVDVSGSMKKNDPNNLRREALRLLIGMLPENARVGIWSFGQYVNMQVKPDFATKAWKENARNEANKVHSLGRYTNIEDTLTKSSWDWRRPDPKWDRHMILLTDGMVDISKDPRKDAKSRQNILGSIVADLTAANVKIHTIALSEQADHKLLKTLSNKSSGWYESVDSADKLQRLFLRLFEKTTKMDSLPIEGNLFDVDSSISDMTLLVFRSASGKKTKVIAPDHSILEYGKASKGVEWFQDKSFDIITVRKPMVGKWKLDADVDKDNRVKIISNLKLKIAPLPVSIIENELINLKASIVTKKGLLKDKEILDLTEVNYKRIKDNGDEIVNKIPATNTPGTYKAVLDGLDDKGTVQVVINVKSPTFKRESRVEIKILENPVKLKLKATNNGLVIHVTEDPLILQTGTLQLALRIEGNDGAYYVTKFGAHAWQATLDNSFAGKSITINATANRLGNISFKSTLHGRLPEAVQPIKDPMTVWAEEAEAGLVIKALLEEDILQTGTIQLDYYTKDHKQQTTSIAQHSDGVWQQLLLPEHAGQTLMVQLKAHLLNGEEFEKEYSVDVPKLEVKEAAVDETASDEKAHKEELVDQAAHDDKDMHEDEPDESNAIVIIISLIVSNLLIFGGAYFGYRYWRKKHQPLEDDLEEDTSDTDKSSADKIEDQAPQETSEAETAPLTEPDEEDFSSQRKEPISPDDVDLSVGEEAQEEVKEEQTDSADLIDTASADELPEFEVDMEEDISVEGDQEKKSE